MVRFLANSRSGNSTTDTNAAKAILNNPSTYEIITPSDFGMSRYVHFASRLTGWNAIKSRVDQLGLQMTDAQVKAVTVKIKAMADVRPLAIDDADSIIRSFHFNLHNDVEKPLLPNMTEQEKEKFEKAQKEIAAEPEKRELDETVDKEADVPRAKKTKTSIAA